MSDSDSRSFEPQDTGKDIAPKDGSSSGDNPLIDAFGSRKPISHGNSAAQNLSQQSKHEPSADPKKLPPQARVDELQHSRTEELKGEENHKSPQNHKIIENTLISRFADPEEYIQQINRKKTESEEERRKDFERNLRKLALFAYEAEEGAEMLERGENPFLEEVDRMLQEIDNEGEPFPGDIDQLLQEIDSSTEPLPTEINQLLQETNGSGTGPLSEKIYGELEQQIQQKKQKKSTDSNDAL